MEIEFRKVPFSEKEFSTDYNSVTLEGTFCKISPSLVKIDAVLSGTTPVDCCRCGDEYIIEVDEKLDFLLSDGVFKGSDSEEMIFEIENGIINFDEICESEISSIGSDYFICEKCSNIDDDIEKEY